MHHPLSRSRLLFSILYSLLSLLPLPAQTLLTHPDQAAMEQWVEAQMLRLDTPEKQLGQLIMPMPYYGKGSYDCAEIRQMIDRQITDYGIGGIVFSRTTIAEQAVLTNYAQQRAHEAGLPPLLVGIDAEWGLAMRMTDAVRFPKNRDIGNIQGPARDTLCYLYGRELANECRYLGIHINFGPVIDIDSNSKNPVIGNRSYSADKDIVARCGIYFAHGVEDGGVMAVAKHFPGHGDTSKDSHKVLPRLKLTKKKLLERELVPFQSFINENLGGVMTAHLDLPKVAEKQGMPSSASRQIVHDLLQDEMGFRGLVITDGLAMKGASTYPDISVQCLLAGNDILLQPTPSEGQWQALLKALHEGRLSPELIAKKCRRVLRWKYALILSQRPAFGTRLLPYPQIDTLGLYSRVHSQYAERLADNITRLSGANASRDGIDPTLQTAITQLEYAPDPKDQETSGAVADNEDGLPPLPAIQLPTATPEEVDMNSAAFAEISRLAQQVVPTMKPDGTMSQGAAPGCQVLVMRHGRVVYHQTFGTLGGTPEQNRFGNRPVSAETMYDLASVSKAAGTVPALMLLMDEHQMRFKDRIVKWLPELKGTSYAKLTLQDLLYHESGLQEGYFFYKMQDEPDLHLRDTLMLEKIASLKPKRKQGKYLYSCLNFVLLRYIIERVSGERLDHYLTQRLPDFYGPWLCYNPLEQGVPRSAIAPTEQDDVVRQEFVHGTVHDEIGAWSMGVEGNSGLFGSAQALAPLLQMILNGGELNGKQYLNRELCQQFTSMHSSHSRRGMGFDRHGQGKDASTSCADECSPQTWGHTGFTGTCFWVDPKADLIYIFLSNRICPSRDNRLLMSQGLRPLIQQAVYRSIKSK